MALSIRSPQAEKLARQVASLSGENLTQAIIHALEKRLEALQSQIPDDQVFQHIMDISHRCRALQDHDTRSPDAILDYGAYGVPQEWS